MLPIAKGKNKLCCKDTTKKLLVKIISTLVSRASAGVFNHSKNDFDFL
jgi:hypothetical protein